MESRILGKELPGATIPLHSLLIFPHFPLFNFPLIDLPLPFSQHGGWLTISLFFLDFFPMLTFLCCVFSGCVGGCGEWFPVLCCVELLERMWRRKEQEEKKREETIWYQRGVAFKRCSKCWELMALDQEKCFSCVITRQDNVSTTKSEEEESVYGKACCGVTRIHAVENVIPIL